MCCYFDRKGSKHYIAQPHFLDLYKGLAQILKLKFAVFWWRFTLFSLGIVLCELVSSYLLAGMMMDCRDMFFVLVCAGI